MADVSLLFRLMGDSSDAERAFGDVDEASEKTARGFDKLKEAGAAAGVAAGAAIAAGLLSGMEQEKAIDKLSAQIGAGSPMAEDAGRIAGQLYAEAYGESVGDAAEAVRSVLQGGIIDEDATQEEIKAITASVMDLASTFDVDVQGATNAVSQMIRTGLAPDAQTAMDIIVRGFQQGADKGGDFLDTINEYGTQFRKLGLDGATATALISQGLKAGARDGDVVADALKEFSIRAIDGSEATKGAFEDLGLNAAKMADDIAAGGPRASAGLQTILDGLRNVKDPVLQSRLAVSLFGTQAEDLGQALYALDPASASLGNVAGAAQKMSTALNDNPATKIETFKRSAMQHLTEMTAGMIDWAGKNQGLVKGLAIAIGAIAVVIGAVSAAQAAWAAVQAIQTAATGVATAAQWLWNAALTANPIGLIIVAIAALVAGLIWFFTQTTLGRAIFSTAMQGITTAFQWVWDKAQGLFTWVKSNWQLLLAIITGPIGLAVLAITKHWDTIVDGLKAAKTRITSTASGMWDGIKNAFKAAINFVISGWNRLHFSVPSFSAFGVTVGGFSLGVPPIQMLAQGGIVTAPTLAVVGEAGPEAVVPLSRAGDYGIGGGGPTFVFQISGVVGDEDSVSRTIIATLERARDRGQLRGVLA